MSRQLKHLLLAMCICVFGFIMTGCGAAVSTNVRITSSTKANCTISVGYDDELLSAIADMSDTTKAAIIKDMKKSGAKYSKKKIDGVVYNMFYSTVKNAKLSQVEALLTQCGYTNVCVKSNYFYASFDPDAISNTTAKTAATGKDLDLTDSMSFYMSAKMTFKAKVAATNGKLTKDKKTVSWVIKDASKKKNFYASTSKVIKTAKASSVSNGKSYKAGKKLTVANAKSLAKLTLDGKTIKSGKTVTKKGTHTLMVWSKNGKVQKVTFKIK